MISPAGFENSFREVAPVLAERGPAAAFGEVAARWGLEPDLDAVPGLVERHGLRFA